MKTIIVVCALTLLCGVLTISAHSLYRIQEYYSILVVVHKADGHSVTRFGDYVPRTDALVIEYIGVESFGGYRCMSGKNGGFSDYFDSRESENMIIYNCSWSDRAMGIKYSGSQRIPLSPGEYDYSDSVVRYSTVVKLRRKLILAN